MPLPEASPGAKPFLGTGPGRDESEARYSEIRENLSCKKVISLTLMRFLLLLGKFFLLSLNFRAVLYPSAFKY